MLVCDCGAVRGELQRHGLIGAELGRLQGLLLQRQKRPRLRVQRHASEARAIADNGASSEPAIDDLRVVQVQCTLPSTVPSALVEQQLHFKVQASIPKIQINASVDDAMIALPARAGAEPAVGSQRQCGLVRHGAGHSGAQLASRHVSIHVHAECVRL